MNTKIYNRFKMSERMFRCPICTKQMVFRNENSFVCMNSHCFDLSKYGYINFLPHQSKTKYTKRLFESRRYIFQSGFYNPLKENIECLISEYLGTLSPINLLDAGCGEGFFVPKLLFNNEQQNEVFALDILKDAIVLAAKENKDVKWIVGDVSNIPLQSNSIDILLNIFAPANYSEFLRVLNNDGLIMKVIPGKQYLIELREYSKEQLINKEYSNEYVLQCFHKNMVYLNKKHLFYQLPATKYQLENFIEMTPLMFNIDKTRIRLDEMKQITIDVEIIVGKKHSR